MTGRHATSAPSQRQLRVGEEIRHALIRIFAEAHWRDPDLAGANITLTEVRIGPDLRNATAFVLPFGGGDAARLVAALNRAAPYLRHELGRAVQLRFLPELKFEADSSFDEAARIRARLGDPTVRRDLAAGTGDGAAGNGSDGAPA
jgi:ribosome-binding factor A